MEILLHLVAVLSVALVVAGDPDQITPLHFMCNTYKATNTTLLNENMDAVLASLRANIASTGFATSQQTDGSDPVYGLAQCRKDKSPTDCFKCFSEAEKQIRKCSTSNANGGRVIYDGCFLRYRRTEFYTEYTKTRADRKICGSVKVAKEANNFVGITQSVLNDLCAAALRIDGFFATQMRQGYSNATRATDSQSSMAVDDSNKIGVIYSCR
eukprot:Gb_22677 [translate_table: standard]